MENVRMKGEMTVTYIKRAAENTIERISQMFPVLLVTLQISHMAS